MKHRDDIDILRGISVIAVILFHLEITYFQGGFLGVDVFLVVSGYLITKSLIENYSLKNKFLKIFYFKRFLRLFPTLVFTFTITEILAIYYFLPFEIKELNDNLIYSSLFLENFYLLLNNDYFGSDAKLNPLLHIWSLSIEGQFYLIYPLLFVLTKNIKKIFIFISVLFITSFSSAIFLSFLYPCCNFYLTTSRIWEFFFGALVYFFEPTYRSISSNPKLNFLLKNFSFIAIIFSFHFFNSNYVNPGFINFIPTLATSTFLLNNVQYKKNFIIRFISNFGIKSFSFYLIHWPLIVFLKNRNSIVNLTWLMVLIFILSNVSYKYIEIPFYKSKNIRKSTAFKFLTIPLFLIAFNTFYISYISSNQINIYNTTKIEYGEYLSENISKYNKESFTDNNPNLLIIGDSYSLDLINILEFTDAIDDYEIVLIKKTSGCGNFYNIDFAAYSNKIIKNKRVKCYLENRFSFTNIDNLIFNADIILLASRILPWQETYILKTVENLNQNTNAKIFLIGNKTFLQDNLHTLVESNVEKRKTFLRILTNEEINLDKSFSAKISPNYISMHKFFVNNNGEYNSFLSEDEIYSYDSGHLTKAGAKSISEEFYNTFITKLEN